MILFPLPLWPIKALRLVEERVRERGHPPLTPPIEGGESKEGIWI